MTPDRTRAPAICRRLRTETISMSDDQSCPPPKPSPTEGDSIDATFRNGSLTAISVVIGFSLSFLVRWAGLPGPWHRIDLVALSAIVIGILCQIAALASLLSVQSLLLRNHNRAVSMFLAGLALVTIGVGLAIAGDMIGYGQRLLTG
jgi:hypothetical protein